MRNVRYAFTLSRPLNPMEREYMLKIPGVRQKEEEPFVLRAPFNARDVVQWHLSQIQGLSVVRIDNDFKYVPKDVNLAALLVPPEQVPELKPEIRVKDFQREALAYGQQAMGSIMDLPTGCLSGDTILSVNRGGGARRIRLDELVRKLHGGGSIRSGSRPGLAKEVFWQSDIPTRTASVMPDGSLRLNTVVDAYASGRKEVFLVETSSGKSIKATADHRFLTSDGWRCLGDLHVGDFVLVNIGQKKSTSKAKPQYTMRNGMWGHPHANRSISKRKNRNDEPLARVAEHRLVVEADLNNLDYDVFVRRVRARDVDGLAFLDPATHVVHHKNRDHKDNRLENLEVLSVLEHKHEHDENEQNVLYSAGPDEIVTIMSCGVEETYDLSMEAPYNSFVANDFVVHNSGKTLVGLLYALSRRRPDGSPMRAIVVTRSKVVDQWGAQTDHFFNGVKWLPLYSQTGYEVRESSREQLLSGCRPYYLVAIDSPKVKNVVGWYDTPKEAKEAAIGFANTPLRIPDDVTVLIIGWDILKYRVQALLAWGPRVFVVDEAHAAKNHHRWVPGAYDSEGRVTSWASKDNRSSATQTISRAVAHVLELTATPAPHLPSDIWALADLADPFGYGSYQTCATRYFDGQHTTGVGYSGFTAKGVSNVAEWSWRRQYLVFHVPQSRVDAEMPKLYRTVIRIPLDRQDSAAAAQSEMAAAKKRGAMALLEMRLYLASVAKRTVIREMIEEWFGEQRKSIIFFGRRKAADKQAKLLETVSKQYNSRKDKERDESGYVQHVDRKVQAEVFLVHGETPAEEAKAALAAYIAHPGPCVLVTTTDALGEAVDGMQKGTTRVIVAQLPWTFGRIRQMEGRAKRLEADERTMREGVTYYYLIAEELIDELIYQRVIRYIEMGSELLDDAALRDLSRELSGSETVEELTNSLAMRLLRAYDEDAADVDEMRFDFSPEGARLRSAGESMENHGALLDNDVDIDDLIDAHESNADG